jgi:hypothetical protein
VRRRLPETLLTPSFDMKLKLTLALILGLVAGAAASDVASRSGFPHSKYIIELTFDSSPSASYACTREGSAFGENLSFFDRSKSAQTDCVLYVVGEPRSDGSFDVYVGTQTWYGRLANATAPVKIPASRLRSIKRATF